MNRQSLSSFDGGTPFLVLGCAGSTLTPSTAPLSAGIGYRVTVAVNVLA